MILKPLAECAIRIRVPKDFNFRRTVFSHGWCSLPPFRVTKQLFGLDRIILLENGHPAECSITQRVNDLRITVRSERKLQRTQLQDVERQIRSCLRIDEDLSEFHREARRHPRYRWISRTKSGRLLRAPDVFEDVVKMMCTTNCSWSLTEIMVRNLVEAFGKPFDGGFAFPRAQEVAGTNERFLRTHIRSGYRSPFLLEFAERVASGRLDVQSWRSEPAPTAELFERVKTVKGIGNYAAGNILKLLGRYDYLGLDSWVRRRYSMLHHKGRRVSDRTIESRYAQFGQWKGLFIWLEMTRDWFREKFPFETNDQ